VGVLSAHFTKGETVTPQALKARGLVESARAGVKVLGEGTLSHALVIKDCEVSSSARQKIEAAGGTIS
jgi:large subunit ribosomal protein L15